MLAQNFRSAADLKITEAEYSALIQVLGMLERGELKDAADTPIPAHGDMLFCMNTQGYGCGSPACIGGWVAHLMGVNQFAYVNAASRGPLAELYWNDKAIGMYNIPTATVAEAAIAVRSFLTTGNPKWDEAMA